MIGYGISKSFLKIVNQYIGQINGRTRKSETVLTIHNIATVPTMSIFWLCSCYGLMLYFAARYQINVVYGLAFLGFISIGVSAWASFRVLSGISLKATPQAEACHKGQAMLFKFEIEELLGRKRSHIIVHVGPDQYEIELMALGKFSIVFNVPTEVRGHLLAPMIKLSTPHPVGIWNTHHCWWPQQQGVVYPEPELDAPIFQTSASDTDSNIAEPDGNFDDDALTLIRSYQSGDSKRRLAWKVFAKTDGQILATKHSDAQTTFNDDIHIHEKHVQDLYQQEHRVSRLTSWVLQAHLSGRTFSMETAGCHVLPNKGLNHLKLCLQELSSMVGHETRVGYQVDGQRDTLFFFKNKLRTSKK